MLFIIATAHRVSEGMDAVGPCDRRSQGMSLNPKIDEVSEPEP